MRVSLPERPQISVCVFVLGLLCDSSLLLNAQSQPSSQAKERQIGAQEPLRTAKASRVDRAPKLDGTLDDPIWQHATPIDNFLQREPFEGRPSTEKSEVRILYSKHEVYFGITCFDLIRKGLSQPNCGAISVRNWTITSRSSLTRRITDVMPTCFKSIRWGPNAML